MFSTLQRRHSFSATRGASTIMGREDRSNLTGSHKNPFHRRLKSSTAILVSEDTAQPSRDRIKSLPGTGNEKSSRGRSFMGILKFKKRRKSASAKLTQQTGLKSKVSYFLCHTPIGCVGRYVRIIRLDFNIPCTCTSLLQSIPRCLISIMICWQCASLTSQVIWLEFEELHSYMYERIILNPW